MAYGNPNRLYVIELADGVIKAGITCRGEGRIAEHAKNVPIRRSFLVESFVTGFDAETDLLRRLARIGSVVRGREWFAGVRFAQAVQLAQQVSRKFTNPNPVRKDHLLRRVFAALNFNDQEIAVLDAYCARFGKSRGAACRELVLGAVGDFAHVKNFCANKPLNTTQLICEES